MLGGRMSSRLHLRHEEPSRLRPGHPAVGSISPAENRGHRAYRGITGAVLLAMVLVLLLAPSVLAFPDVPVTPWCSVDRAAR